MVHIIMQWHAFRFPMFFPFDSPLLVCNPYINRYYLLNHAKLLNPKHYILISGDTRMKELKQAMGKEDEAGTPFAQDVEVFPKSLKPKQ